MMDTISAPADATLAVSGLAMLHLPYGKLRGLVVSTLTDARLPPDLPPPDEANVIGRDANNWNALEAPCGTPQPIVMNLHKAMDCHGHHH